MMTDLFANAGPTPEVPLSDAQRCAWIQLVRSPRVGTATFRRLLDEHGTARAALAALPEVARAAGAGHYQPASAAAAAREYEAGLALGAQLLCWGAPDYPELLAETADAPPVLWARGETALFARTGIGLVGARNASALGVRMARHLAADLGRQGLVVVSGLARGIDAAAHAAALESGTIAVLAGGVDIAYPPENVDLMNQIVEAGLLVSEMPPGLQPQARHFPRRNRIISGLCPALVVIEGAAKSGSLITARAALDQGRDVMAVPGHPFDARAVGCNMLIRDGATLVRSAADILAALGLEPQKKAAAPASAAEPATGPAQTAPAQTAPAQPRQSRPGAVPAPPQRPVAARDRAAPPALATQILNALGPAPVSEDILIRMLARPAGEILSLLAELDLEGRVRRHPGGLISTA